MNYESGMTKFPIHGVLIDQRWFSDLSHGNDLISKPHVENIRFVRFVNTLSLKGQDASTVQIFDLDDESILNYGTIPLVERKLEMSRQYFVS